MRVFSPHRRISSICASGLACVDIEISSRSKELENGRKRVGSQSTQIAVPDVLFILFYLSDDVPHHPKNCRIIIIVDISLKQFDHIQAIAVILHKGCK